ncbi:hypothetical protein QYE76_020422 [Lolium multiflorum]|uniref:MADS-box domain-containing protein n=1 Tax=Lolium multiflorum TaxID=4521 RepID=A0AAD8R688_LOLMU|nr:hypothetical protein QYE76_020422 [Lolium multiflorum]
MARKKVSMAYIANDPTRKATGKKRATGAIKKAGELSVLCGVDACLIIVLEDGSLQLWPSSLPEAMGVVDRYRALPEVDQCRKKMDGEEYVRDRVGKMQEQLRKAERDNRQRENTLLLHDAMVGGRPNLAGLPVEQLVSVGWMTENLIKKIKDCITYRGGQLAGVNDDPLPYAATVAGVEAPHLQREWVMAYNGGSSGSGSSGSVGAGGDVMQLGSINSRFAWPEGNHFPQSD